VFVSTHILQSTHKYVQKAQMSALLVGSFSCEPQRMSAGPWKHADAYRRAHNRSCPGGVPACPQAYLKFNRGVPGPHLIVVPLSVLPNWIQEFKRFAPDLRVVRIHVNDEGGAQQAWTCAVCCSGACRCA